MRNRYVLFLLFSTFSTTGCLGAKLFQPSPPEYQLWTKKGEGEDSIVLAMKVCGYENYNGIFKRNLSLNEEAEIFQCMKKRGFTYYRGFDFCTTFKDRSLPACR